MIDINLTLNVAPAPVSVEGLAVALPGKQGADGKSAYDVAVTNGFEGTVEEWLESLKGEKGEPGDSSSGGSDRHFVFEQTQASDTWEITHNLNKYPSVSVADSAGSVVVGDVEYISPNELRIKFIGAFSGRAYLN